MRARVMNLLFYAGEGEDFTVKCGWGSGIYCYMQVRVRNLLLNAGECKLFTVKYG